MWSKPIKHDQSGKPEWLADGARVLVTRRDGETVERDADACTWGPMPVCAGYEIVSFEVEIPLHERPDWAEYWFQGTWHMKPTVGSPVVKEWREEATRLPAVASPVPSARPCEWCGGETTPGRSKYHREVTPGVWVDVYDVLQAWAVTCPALQHLIKKALAPGQRGHKSALEDLREVEASAKRAIELEENR